jgi:hypothetical protein
VYIIVFTRSNLMLFMYRRLSRVNGAISPSKDASDSTKHLAQDERAAAVAFMGESSPGSHNEALKQAMDTGIPLAEWMGKKEIAKIELNDQYQRAVIDHIAQMKKEVKKEAFTASGFEQITPSGNGSPQDVTVNVTAGAGGSLAGGKGPLPDARVTSDDLQAVCVHFVIV